MKGLITLLFSMLIACTGFAQSPGSIVGKWLNEEKDGRIEIYESKGKYYGKLVWMKDPYEADGKTLKRDVKNKNSKLKGQPLLNSVIFSGFKFEEGKWVDGEVYDPRSGKTYSSEIKLKNNKLELRGYIGNPIFGKTAVFTKG